MNVQQFTLILAAVFLLSMLLLGSGIALYRGQRKKDSERIADEKRTLLVQEDEPETETATVSVTDPDVDQVEILRLLRDSIDGQLSVNVLGKPTGSVEDMTPAQRKQLKRALEELTRWLEASSEGIEKPGEVEETPAVNADEPPAGPAYFADTLPERVEITDVLPFRKKNIPKLKEAPPAPKSIVAQIDEILQNKLAGSPLADKNIRLSEDLGGGLKILVEEKVFLGIDDVDDPAVRALIKQAVREWNDNTRLKPG